MIELRNTFTIPASVDEAWAVLLDIERVAPCMPGAKLESLNGDQFEGSVKVKLGAMVLTYRGTAKIVERDEGAHRAVIEAAAKESRGAGTAKANVIAALHDRGGETEVEVVTELHVTGKPAQFGRGVMADVSERLIGQFADRLREEMVAPAADPAPTSSAPAAPSGPQESSGDTAQTSAPEPVRQVRDSDEPIDLLAVAGGPLAKRAAGAAAALLALLVVFRVAFRRSGGSTGRRSGLQEGVTVLCSCGHEGRVV